MFTPSELPHAVRLEPIDESRYEMEAPSGAAAENPDAWLAALNNARAQLEHALVRQVNVDLLGKFGTAAWRRECDYLDKLADGCAPACVWCYLCEVALGRVRSPLLVRVVCRAIRMKKKLASLQEEIEAVNRERKNLQEAHSSRLQSLARKWMEITQKNVQIEVSRRFGVCAAPFASITRTVPVSAGGMHPAEGRDRPVSRCCRGRS